MWAPTASAPARVGTDARVEVLGPVRFLLGGRPLTVGNGLRLAALTALAGRPGRPVATERLLRDLWGDEPPATAEGSVYTYMAGIRKALAEHGAGELLTSGPCGYALDLPPSAVDAVSFEQACARAGAHAARGDHHAGAREFRSALDLWRGEPLSGIPGPLAAQERDRLREALWTAREAEAAARLELGDHEGVAADLTALVEQSPLRESLWALRLRALTLAARPAEALAVYRELEDVLRRELGTAPGPETRALRDEVLAGDDGPTSSRPTFPGPIAVVGRNTVGAAVTGGHPPVLAELRPRRLHAADAQASVPSRPAVSEGATALLRWAAVLGDEVALAQLFALAGSDDAAPIRELVSAGILRPSRDGVHVRFDHLVTRDEVYAGIPPSFRAVMHTEAAQALARLGGHRADVARHLVLQGPALNGAAIGWLTGNAYKLSAESPTAAAELIDRALADHRLEPVARERLRVSLARANFRLSRLSESLARQVVANALDPDHVAEVRQLLAVTLMRLGRPAEGAQLLTENPPGSATGEVWHARHRRLLSHLRHVSRVSMAAAVPGTRRACR